MKIYILILVITLIYGCAGREKLAGRGVPDEIPPGTVKIAHNLYCDASEVSNFSYLEYLYWTRRVFGEAAYVSALPDTTVWRQNDCLSSYGYFYHDSVAYRDFPVVGLTYEQALAFTRWRADRVMEFILVRENHISISDVVSDTANYFSIERYYSGEYKMKKQVPLPAYYPHYHLPSQAEWSVIRLRADSVNRTLYQKMGKRSCVADTAMNCIRAGGVPVCADGKKKREPLKKSGCYKRNKTIIQDLVGNLREMSSEKGISLGGSWMDSLHLILSKDTFRYNVPDNKTGFRNVCEWRIWKGGR